MKKIEMIKISFASKLGKYYTSWNSPVRKKAEIFGLDENGRIPAVGNNSTVAVLHSLLPLRYLKLCHVKIQLLLLFATFAKDSSVNNELLLCMFCFTLTHGVWCLQMLIPRWDL